MSWNGQTRISLDICGMKRCPCSPTIKRQKYLHPGSMKSCRKRQEDLLNVMSLFWGGPDHCIGHMLLLHIFCKYNNSGRIHIQ
ncbi:hypothetical protein GDO81_025642 [Engystomops pustulosus]|uniref:Uncharacterized protein n=1 Tax=Engystomops pustulosus TaxID=76066 RepID=A0AAV6YH66_ENGPU|nr:hypothetical protein GDO81_025642 [Engystomops pustulosus]